jgi:hypothetical protein
MRIIYFLFLMYSIGRIYALPMAMETDSEKRVTLGRYGRTHAQTNKANPIAALRAVCDTTKQN